eukprot:1148881-Alexandrium_andersonii.AAC.1
MLVTAGRHRIGGGQSRTTSASVSVRHLPLSLIGAIGAPWHSRLGMAHPSRSDHKTPGQFANPHSHADHGIEIDTPDAAWT